MKNNSVKEFIETYARSVGVKLTKKIRGVTHYLGLDGKYHVSLYNGADRKHHKVYDEKPIIGRWIPHTGGNPRVTKN